MTGELRCDYLFSLGDQVLALLPVIGFPFQAKFRGPYTVQIEQLPNHNLIATPERRKANPLCHVNLLKPYYTGLSSELTKS